MSEPRKAMEIIERDRRTMRNRALATRILYVLRDTLQIRHISQDIDPKELRIDFTDESLRAIAPLVESVDILESIIWASDGCVGHRQCAHSMEPWQRARTLLNPKWESETDPSAEQWPNITATSNCHFCGGYLTPTDTYSCPRCGWKVEAK